VSPLGEIIIAGRRWPLRAPVKTWLETGLVYAPAPLRRQTWWIVNHWTGSENTPEQAFANMRARKCSVHFLVDQLGVIYQFADAQARLAHAKPQRAGDVLSGNSYGVGIEIVNRGHGEAPEKGFIRRRRTEKIHGETITYGEFFAAQIASVIELNAALCDAYGLPLRVPMKAGAVYPTVLPRNYLATYRGALGHLQLDPAKPDPGLDLLEQIHRAGLPAPPSVA
jgi:N-acetylmuramoyl-L-alanine amidase